MQEEHPFYPYSFADPPHSWDRNWYWCLWNKGRFGAPCPRRAPYDDTVLLPFKWKRRYNSPLEEVVAPVELRESRWKLGEELVNSGFEKAYDFIAGKIRQTIGDEADGVYRATRKCTKQYRGIQDVMEALASWVTLQICRPVPDARAFITLFQTLISPHITRLKKTRGKTTR